MLVPWLVQDVKQTSVEKYPIINGFVPVITEADINAYLMADGHPTNEGDPRYDLDDSPWNIAKMLYFLGWVAQFKAMTTPQSEPGHFGYETMLYAYHDIAEAIAAL